MAGALSAKGQPAKPSDLGSKVNGIQLVDGKWMGAADPRSEGAAVAVDAKGKLSLIDGKAAEGSAPTATVH
jgi:gamma-glutamyltranspeptidase / glutathione hydrolase